MAYHLEEMSKEEGETMTKEIQAILEKYNAEMGVNSAISLMKRVEDETPVVSPYLDDKKPEAEVD